MGGPECFSILAGVLTTRYPSHAQDFFAYHKTIVHASRSFAGDHWVTYYDLCYRRRAAATKCLQWSLIDFSLYNETFTGRAKPMPRCRYCLSEHHIASDCSFAPDPSPPASQLSQISLMLTMVGINSNQNFLDSVSKFTRWSILIQSRLLCLWWPAVLAAGGCVWLLTARTDMQVFARTEAALVPIFGVK